MEEWRAIDPEGRYQVSNLGNVRSCVDFHGKISKNYHLLKPRKGNHGYLMVILHLNNKKVKGCLVHRLVAEAFIPNTLNYRCINHKDENKMHNNVENLEWCDYKYNNNYGTKSERLSKSLINNPHFSKPVYQLDKQGNIINEYPSIMEAARSVGGFDTCINKVCRGEKYRHTAYGYSWKYKE